MNIAIYILLTILSVIVLLKVFGRKMERTKEEVVDFLKRMESREVDGAGWDRFLNIPVKDRYLDSVRERCEVLREYDEFLMQNEDGDFVLNDRGISEIRKLISELEQQYT
jgi:myosin-crossreactive antigen